MSDSRKIKQWSEKDFVRNRLPVWLGSAMPRTVSAKEIIDNGIDQINDNIAHNVVVEISKEYVSVFDDGRGISLESSGDEKGQSHLFLAFGKLYTSSNYEGGENTVGTNGVGGSVTNFISDEFKAGIITNKHFKGYVWNNGVHSSEGQTFDEIDMPELTMNNGFYVYAKYNPEITEDDINIDWIINYTEKRVGELPKGSRVIINIKSDNPQSVEFNRIDGDNNYVKSWEEQVIEAGSTPVKMPNGFTYAFSKVPKAFEHVSSMVQMSPVHNSTSLRATFQIDKDASQAVSIPYTFFYKSTKSPKYTDQTKQQITIKSADIIKAMKLKDPDMYNHYYKMAKDMYLKSILKENTSDSYWPSLGKAENSELIIAEGYSAVSGIKAKRNPDTQACLGLRGKILNVMQKSLKNAMKSDIVAELLSIIKTNDFKRIIIAVDADPSGSHICTLLLAVFHRFAPQLLEEGKVYYCHTPLYTFRKGSDYKWSDDGNDCPEGYRTHVLKGLGSMEAEEIEMFILNDKTRDLWQFEYDMPNAEKMLNFSLVTGGKGWIDGVEDKEYESIYGDE